LAATAAADRKMICLNGLQRVLRNIGVDSSSNDARLTTQELKGIFQELGGGDANLIPVERMAKLL
jgi:hypothetical protein